MPKITGKHSSHTKIDHPHKRPECMKTYLHQQDLNRHIRTVHDLVKYTCTRCLCSFIRQYNLTEHLLEYCVPKVGSALVRRIPFSEFLHGYKIPTLDPQVMPRCMNPTTVRDCTTTPLEVTTHCFPRGRHLSLAQKAHKWRPPQTGKWTLLASPNWPVCCFL